MDKDKDGNPTEAIEITSVMLKVGIAEYLAYSEYNDYPEDAVREIFTAMSKASRAPSPQER